MKQLTGLFIILLCSGVLFAQKTEKPLSLSYADCGLSEKAVELAKLIIEDPKQQRTQLSCNRALARIAHDKAKEMAGRGEVSHYLMVDGERFTPNQRLAKAGYRLPKESLVDEFSDNNGESILGGYKELDVVLKKFRQSFVHEQHVFGLTDFFKPQTQIGVGYYRKWKSPHVDYWVVYIVRAAENLPEYDGEQ